MGRQWHRSRSTQHCLKPWTGAYPSRFGDGDDRFGKGLRGFLRQIVPDAARDDPVRILARELLGIGTGIRVWCAIGITV